MLQKAGVHAHFEEGKTIDSYTFSKARVAKVGKSEMYKQPWGKGERIVEVIGETTTSSTQRSKALIRQLVWKCLISVDGSGCGRIGDRGMSSCICYP